MHFAEMKMLPHKKLGTIFSRIRYLRIHVFAVTIFTIGILIFGQVFAATGVPQIINFQGRLLDSSANLLGGSSGTNYCFRFSLYDAATSGTKLWPASTPSTMTLPVRQGVFDANIGDTGAGGDALTYDFQSNNSVYVDVQVAAQVSGSCSGVTFETLTPRQQIVSSGYAINSGTVGGFTAAQSAVTNQIPVLTSGKLVLGDAAAAIQATGTTALTIQGGGATGNIQFFSGSNTLSSSGNLTLAGGVTASTINGNTITTGTGVLTLAAGKTLTASNTLTLAGTDGSTLNIGTGGTLGTNAYTSTAYAPLASPTFTGTVTLPSPFTLGSTSVTSTGTQLNYLNAATGTTGTTSSNLVFSTSPTITGGTLTTTSVNGVTLSTGGGTTTFLNANGAYSTPAGGTTYTFSTGLTNTSGTVTVNTSQNISTLSNLTSNGIVTTSGGTGALSVTGTTGTGNVALATSPTFVTPVLGAATATSINGLTITSSTGTLTVGTGSTLATSGAFTTTFTSTGTTNLTLPTSGTLLTTTGNGSSLTGIPTSVSNSDSSLTISPTTGAVVASLNLANPNIFTAVQTVNKTALGVTTVDGLLLENTTAAAVNVQQMSPSIHWSGFGWATGAGASQPVDFRANLLPAQASNVFSTWQLQSSLNGAAYANVLTVSNGGVVTATSFTGTVNGALATSSTLNTSGFGATNSTSSTVTSAAALFAGATTVNFRLISNGTANAGPAAGTSYSTMIIAGSAVTVPASGTSGLFASAVIKALAISPTAGTGVLTASAALYVDGISTNATNNYGLLVNSGTIATQGNLSTKAWGANGVNFQTVAATYTDNSTASGTVTNNMVNSFGIPTLAATNASITYSNAATVYIAGAPVAGTNATLTNTFALDVAGGNAVFGGQVGVVTLAAGTATTLCYNTTAITGFNVIATCSSDQRLKQNITPLTDDTLDNIMKLNPVSFNWDPSFSADQTLQYGLIAQQVAQVFPNLVSKTAPTPLTPDGTYSINFNGLYSPIIKSIQEMNLNVTSIADLTRTNTWRDALLAWLGSATNGIDNIFSKTVTANQVNTEQLCVGPVGKQTCVTQSQLQQMLSGSGGSSGTTSSNSAPIDTTVTNPDPVVPAPDTATASPDVAPVSVDQGTIQTPDTSSQ